MKKTIPYLLCVTLMGTAFIGTSYAQLLQPFNQGKQIQNSSWCHAQEVTERYVQEQLQKTPSFGQLRAVNSNAAFHINPIHQSPSINHKSQITSRKSPIANHQNAAKMLVVRTIPVVVHVVYRTGAENISDAAINGMIATMTEDYRRQNPDASNTRAQFVGVATDAEIEFCLASKDPFGASTTGITRTLTTEVSYDPDTETNKMKNDATGGKTGWDAYNYLNIWICNIAGNTGGYAYYPTFGMHGSSIDGLVVDYQTVGYGGRTATHEVGHYFNIAHIWGGSQSCGSDDGFTDTPTSDGPNYFCNFSDASCSSTDMIENYMDYTSCTNMFTIQQAAEMNSILSGVRSSLLSSTGCEPTAPPVANFTSDKTTVQVGGWVVFTDLSTGIPDTWSWNFGGGGTPNISTVKNPTIQFNTIGTYTVTLDVSNILGSDTEIKTNYINVIATTGCDTLNWNFMTTTSLYTLGCGPTCGETTGANQYDDLSKTQLFTVAEYSPNTHVTGGLFYFYGAYKDPGSSAKVAFNVWASDGGGGSPGTILGTDTVDLADIVSDVQGNFLTQVLFNQPVLVTGDFYFGFNMVNFNLWAGPTSDSLGLVGSHPDTSATGSPAWEEQSNNSWNTIPSRWNWGGLDNPTLFATPYMTNLPPTANFTANITSGCEGLSVTFDASASINADYYLWDVDGDGVYDYLDTVDATITITYDTVGTFDVILLVVGPCTGLSKITLSNYITIYPAPILTTSKSDATCGNCDGSATVTPSGGTPTYNYQWDDPLSQTTQTANNLCGGTYQIVVTDANGCSAGATVTVSDGASMALTISTTDACGGANGTATVSVTGGTGPYTYQWDDPLAQTTSTADSLAAGSYNVTITDVNGCFVSTDLFNLAVINNLPPPSTPTATNNGPLCEGATLNLTTPFVAGATYSWTGPNAFSSSLQNPNIASITLAMTGVYSVTVTVSGCTSSAGTTTVVINSVPATPTATNSGPLCEGVTLNLTTPFVAGATYSWTGPNAFSSSLQNPNISSVTLAMAGVYSITVTVSGCASSAGTTTVVINSAPTAPVAGTNATYCDGDAIADLTATGSNIEWFSDAGLTILIGTGSPFAISPGVGTTTYYITQTVSGCQSPSSTVAITVNPVPIIGTESKTDATTCTSNDGTITITASGGTGTLSYSIDGGVTFPNTTGLFTGLGTGSYPVIVSDINNCTVTGSTLTITAPGAPPAPTAGTDATYCQGDAMADLTATTGSGGTLSWYDDAGLTNVVGTGTTFTPSPTVTTTYYVTETVSGCASSPASVTITVNPNPSTPTITEGGGSLMSSSAINYQWFFLGDTIAGATSQFYTPTQNGFYSVTVTDANGCSSTSAAFAFPPTGIEESAGANSLSIYPNPTTGTITLEFALDMPKDINITVTNILGEIVSTADVDNVTSEIYTIDLSGKSNGVYFIRILTDEEVIVKKISLVK